MAGGQRQALNHLHLFRRASAAGEREVHSGQPFAPQEPQRRNQQDEYQRYRQRLLNHRFGPLA